MPTRYAQSRPRLKRLKPARAMRRQTMARTDDGDATEALMILAMNTMSAMMTIWQVFLLQARPRLFVVYDAMGPPISFTRAGCAGAMALRRLRRRAESGRRRGFFFVLQRCFSSSRISATLRRHTAIAVAALIRRREMALARRIPAVRAMSRRRAPVSRAMPAAGADRRGNIILFLGHARAMRQVARRYHWPRAAAEEGRDARARLFDACRLRASAPSHQRCRSRCHWSSQYDMRAQQASRGGWQHRHARYDEKLKCHSGNEARGYFDARRSRFTGDDIQADTPARRSYLPVRDRRHIETVF